MRKPNLRRRENPPADPAADWEQPGDFAQQAEYSGRPAIPPDAWAPAPLNSDPYVPPPHLSPSSGPYPPRSATQPRHAATVDAGAEPEARVSQEASSVVGGSALGAVYGSYEGLPVSVAAAQASDSGRWDPIVVDRPTFDVEPKPSLTGSYRPDTEFDGWSTSHATMRMASVRGYRHRYYGKPRQDHAQSAVHVGSGTVVFAVADGVSSAEQSEQGALIACRTAINAVLDHLERGPENPPVEWNRVLSYAAARLVNRAAQVLHEPEPELMRVEQLFATTLVVGYARPTEGGLDVHIARVGDSGAWVLDPNLPGSPYVAVFALKTAPDAALVSNAVSPLPRVPAQIEQQFVRLLPGVVLLVGTDGFGDPLGDGDGQVGELFARHLSAPPAPRQLAHVLDFSRETFDDDRTLLALWPRERDERP
ncbi:MAG TPA: protein phosphatase 2C domain-containing protein [Actinocrinis sp.]|nr:protein phosphatase 2C domain-containing protein [Actinocrinis sp.]